MPSIADIRIYLTISQIVAYVFLLRKLFVSKLLKKYRYFSLLIATEAIRLPVMSLLPQRSKMYAHAYFITAPIIWILFVLVVLEFFQLILRNHVGIATMGRKAVSWALAVSALISAGTLLLDLQHTNPEAALLYNFMLLERLVMTSLFVLLLCLILFASHFPVPLARNLRVHACIFAAYFAVRTGMFFVRVLFGLDLIVAINIVGQLLAIACLFAWAVLLEPAGEVVAARRPSSASEERLLAQLEAINDSLIRSARK